MCREMRSRAHPAPRPSPCFLPAATPCSPCCPSTFPPKSRETTPSPYTCRPPSTTPTRRRSCRWRRGTELPPAHGMRAAYGAERPLCSRGCRPTTRPTHGNGMRPVGIVCDYFEISAVVLLNKIVSSSTFHKVAVQPCQCVAALKGRMTVESGCISHAVAAQQAPSLGCAGSIIAPACVGRDRIGGKMTWRRERKRASFGEI